MESRRLALVLFQSTLCVNMSRRACSSRPVDEASGVLGSRLGLMCLPSAADRTGACRAFQPGKLIFLLSTSPRIAPTAASDCGESR
jgi:hypothetical protein